MVEHICSVATANNGYGIACGFSGAIEVYSHVIILKLS